MPEIRTRHIVCANGLPAFVATPIGATPSPLVVLMHERYGLVQHTMDLAQRFSREGYACVAPNFFYKHPDQDALHRGDEGCKLSDPDAVRYIDEALDAVKDVGEINHGKIAVMGVCQTGRYPLVYAAQRPVRAAVAWYGAASPREWLVDDSFPAPFDDLIAKIECPVIGIFGEGDHIISIDDVLVLRSSLERHRKSYTIEIVGNAPHGWLNDTMPGRYRRKEAEEGWSAQRAFLANAFSDTYDKTRRIQKYTASISADYDYTKNVRFE